MRLELEAVLEILHRQELDPRTEAVSAAVSHKIPIQFDLLQWMR